MVDCNWTHRTYFSSISSEIFFGKTSNRGYDRYNKLRLGSSEVNREEKKMSTKNVYTRFFPVVFFPMAFFIRRLFPLDCAKSAAAIGWENLIGTLSTFFDEFFFHQGESTCARCFNGGIFYMHTKKATCKRDHWNIINRMIAGREIYTMFIWIFYWLTFDGYCIMNREGSTIRTEKNAWRERFL